MLFKYPKRLPEANIQAELYKQLTNLGFHVMLEYKHENSRFDIIVYSKGQIDCIIEVKRSSKAKTDTKQLDKYRSFGITVLVCLGWSDISRVKQLVMDSSLAYTKSR